MQDNLFYAKVDMEALRQIGEIGLKPIPPPYQTYPHLPTPAQQSQVHVKISNPYIATDIFLYGINLNPKCIILKEENLLCVGILSMLEGYDGWWCLINHCNKCHYKSSTLLDCAIPNCANNPLFRKSLQDLGQYIGKMDNIS